MSNVGEETLLIHKYDDGGASFGWLRDSEILDWEYWRIATDDEVEIWIIAEMLHSDHKRDIAFRWAVDTWKNDPAGSMKVIALICDMERNQ